MSDDKLPFKMSIDALDKEIDSVIDCCQMEFFSYV